MNDKTYMLCRGTTKSGNIVTGHLTVLDSDYNGISKGMYISNSEGMPFAYEVIPESIKRCTGHYDKNNNLLFEDDFIVYSHTEDNKKISIELMIKWDYNNECWAAYNGQSFNNIMHYNKSMIELVKNTKEPSIQLYRGIDINDKKVVGQVIVLKQEFEMYLPGVYISDGNYIFAHKIKPDTLSECTPYKDKSNNIICVGDVITVNNKEKYIISKKENGLYIGISTESENITKSLEDLINSGEVECDNI